MDCRHAQHLLDSYLDGQLPSSLRAEIHAHRLTCPRCQRAMAIVEVAADVIATDRSEPDLSLSFTDRVMKSMKPHEPRVARRVIRLRRVAVVLGPMLSAAAGLVFVVSAMRPTEHVPSPSDILRAGSGIAVTPVTAGIVEVSGTPPAPSATIANTLAEGLLTPALTAWQDTQRSTQDLVALGRLALRAAGQTLGSPAALAAEEGGDAAGAFDIRSVFRNMLTPKPEGETVQESPDML